MNNGAAADRIGAFQGTVNYGTRVSAPACSAGAGFSGVLNTAAVGGITAVLTNTTGAAGVVTLYTCTFTYGASGSQTLTSAAGSHLAGDQTGYDFTSLVSIITNPIP